MQFECAWRWMPFLVFMSSTTYQSRKRPRTFQELTFGVWNGWYPKTDNDANIRKHCCDGYFYRVPLQRTKKNDIRLTKINLCGKMFEIPYCCVYTVFSLLSWLELWIDRHGDCFHGDGRAWVCHCDSPGAAGGCVRTPWLPLPSSGGSYMDKLICADD